MAEVQYKRDESFHHFDEAVKHTGYGRFHYEVLIVSALSILSMGFQNGLSSYIFPAAQCELGLKSFELGVLNMAFMIGGIASCFLWGALADNIGRRNVLIFAHLVDATVTCICAVLPGSIILTVCRFLNGFFVGAPGSIIFTYVAEFQPPKYRSPVVCSCGIFFTLSWLLLPLSAYLILPMEGVSFTLGNYLVLAPWRLYLIILSLPEFLTGIWLLKMPETPKYFLAKGRHSKSLHVLKRMYSTNTGEDPEAYPVKNLVGEMKVKTKTSNRNMLWSKTIQILRSMGKQMKSLFTRPLLKITALTCCIMFANMFGMFGLGLWLPEFFIRFDQYEKMYPNATATIKELSKLTQAQTPQFECEPTFDSAVTFNTVVTASSALLFNTICSLLATKLHFKIIPLITMLIGGASSASIFFLSSSLQNLIVSCVFLASMITANMTIGSIAVELFPTKVVGVALCLVMCFGRLGAMSSSFIFGYFMDSHCEIPISVVAGVVLCGGLLCFVVPRKSFDAKVANLSTTHAVEVATISGLDIKFK